MQREVIEIVEWTEVEREFHQDGSEQLKALDLVFDFIQGTFSCRRQRSNECNYIPTHPTDHVDMYAALLSDFESQQDDFTLNSEIEGQPMERLEKGNTGGHKEMCAATMCHPILHCYKRNSHPIQVGASKSITLKIK